MKGELPRMLHAVCPTAEQKAPCLWATGAPLLIYETHHDKCFVWILTPGKLVAAVSLEVSSRVGELLVSAGTGASLSKVTSMGSAGNWGCRLGWLWRLCSESIAAPTTSISSLGASVASSDPFVPWEGGSVSLVSSSISKELYWKQAVLYPVQLRNS